MTEIGCCQMLTQQRDSWFDRRPLRKTASTSQRSEIVLAVAIAFYMTISSALMAVFGIPYDGDGGNIIIKIHIGSYLAVLAFFMTYARDGNFIGDFVTAAAANKALFIYFICMIFDLFYYVSFHKGGGAAFIVESLIMPGIIGFTLVRFSDRTKSVIFIMIIALFTLNSSIAIIETITKHNLVPYTVHGGDIEIKSDIFRSTALLGHPLINAALTSVALFSVMMLRVSFLKRAIIMVVMFLSLLSFGGRTAFGISLAVIAAYLLFCGLKNLALGRYNYIQVLGALLAAGLLVGGLIGVVTTTDFGSRIVNHMEVDESAKVRQKVWQIATHMDSHEIMMGVEREQMIHLAEKVGIIFPKASIENFWLIILIMLGVNGFTPFVIGFFSGGIYLWRQVPTPGRIALLAFLAIASTNNSLAAKTIDLAMVMSMMICAAGHNRLMDQRETANAGARAERRIRYSSPTPLTLRIDEKPSAGTTDASSG